jgi:hypothetical protein
MGQIFSCCKKKITPENIYKMDIISSKNTQILSITKTVVKNKSFENIGSLYILPMSRHGSMRHSRSLNFLNLL